MELSRRLIPDRGEFIDALRALRRGHILVRISDLSGGTCINGVPLFHSFDTLREWGLIDEFHNPQGFKHAHYYRLSESGTAFAERAIAAWRGRPLLQRLAMRFIG
jgi:hypothetical protein